MKSLDPPGDDSWTTVSFTATPLGLTAQERLERFRIEALTELVLRLFGGVTVAASTVLWLLLPSGSATGEIASDATLAGLVSAVGLSVYAYGSRGFRRQLSLDAKRRTMALTKVNIHDRGRVVRRIRLHEIESLFLRRPATRSQHAALFVRTRRQDAPFLALTGACDELEHVHRELCRSIQRPMRETRPAMTPATGLVLARR